MERIEKIKLAIEKGITCDINTGKVYGIKNNVLESKNNLGYKYIRIHTKNGLIRILQHHFIFYKAYGKISNEIDHINRNPSDNRLENLREVSHKQNCHNQNRKGYCLNKSGKKWRSQITLDCKKIYLGTFDSEIEARQAYLNAKKIYHIL
jgi:hypothetical protein